MMSPTKTKTAICNECGDLLPLNWFKSGSAICMDCETEKTRQKRLVKKERKKMEDLECMEFPPRCPTCDD